MSALANKSFAKMNGVGNEIVVVDLRASPVAISAGEARAIAAGVPYDQLMALYPPKLAGTEAFIRIYNNDGSEAGACGNGMRCVARQMFAGSSENALTFETRAGLLNMLARAVGRDLHRRHGQAEIRLAGHPARRGVPRHALDRIADRPDRRAGAAHAVRRQHGQPARDLLGRRRQCHDLHRFGPLLENHPIFPDRANITLAHIVDRDHIVIRTWERGAGLTQGLRLGRLRDRGRRGTAAARQPQGDDLAARRRSRHRMARERRSRADDRAGRARIREPFRSGAVRQRRLTRADP